MGNPIIKVALAGGLFWCLSFSAAQGATLVDPTRPADVAEIPAAGGSGGARARGPELQYTMISPSRRVAVINGKSFIVGEKFEGAVIVDIRPYEVILSKAGRETSLRLLPKVVTKKEITGPKIQWTLN